MARDPLLHEAKDDRTAWLERVLGWHFPTKKVDPGVAEPRLDDMPAEAAPLPSKSPVEKLRVIGARFDTDLALVAGLRQKAAGWSPTRIPAVSVEAEGERPGLVPRASRDRLVRDLRAIGARLEADLADVPRLRLKAADLKGYLANLKRLIAKSRGLPDEDQSSEEALMRQRAAAVAHDPGDGSSFDAVPPPSRDGLVRDLRGIGARLDTSFTIIGALQQKAAALREKAGDLATLKAIAALPQQAGGLPPSRVPASSAQEENERPTVALRPSPERLVRDLGAIGARFDTSFTVIAALQQKAAALREKRGELANVTKAFGLAILKKVLLDTGGSEDERPEVAPLPSKSPVEKLRVIGARFDTDLALVAGLRQKAAGWSPTRVPAVSVEAEGERPGLVPRASRDRLVRDLRAIGARLEADLADVPRLRLKAADLKGYLANLKRLIAKSRGLPDEDQSSEEALMRQRAAAVAHDPGDGSSFDAVPPPSRDGLVRDLRGIGARLDTSFTIIGALQQKAAALREKAGDLDVLKKVLSSSTGASD